MFYLMYERQFKVVTSLIEMHASQVIESTCDSRVAIVNSSVAVEHL